MEVLPGVRIDELDDRRHAKEFERCVAGEEPEGEQDRQDDFGGARQGRDEFRLRTKPGGALRLN